MSCRLQLGPGKGQHPAGTGDPAWHGTRSEMTGPCRVVRTSSGTGAPPRTSDLSRADRERLAAVGRQVAAGIGRVDLLDEQVLGIGAGVGEAPGELAVAPQHDERQAGQGGPDHG